MGGQLSTSNHVVDMSKGTEIETDHPVLFTIELGDLNLMTPLDSGGRSEYHESRVGAIPQSDLQLDGQIG